jgi:hypothetical protein
MLNLCRHILINGQRCKAAALRGQAFCYYHVTARRYTSISTTSADPLLLPSTEDAAGVLLALNQVLRGLASRRIDHRQARAFFQGLQIAARLARKSDDKPGETVRETCEDADGQTLAPEKSSCEPPADCVNCRRRNFCENFPLYKRKVEKLEERLESEREANEPELEDKEA